MSRAPVWGEVAVPMLMLGSDRPAVDAAYRASHANVMATLLDLMSVPIADRKFTYAASLLTAKATDVDVRRVMTGAFFGDGPGDVEDFDELAREHARTRR